MAGPSWLVDSNRIARKIKIASGAHNPEEVQWTSNPSKTCPNCRYVIDNSDIPFAWPGLPRGVKFDPNDQEIMSHLLAKVGDKKFKPHPFINEFIPTVNEEDGICYTHPQNLPGVNQDGSVSHFFHKAIKAYNTGTRKRRKINGDDSGDVRWHKTGRTKPVFVDGLQRGCKKIMVLYVSPARGGRAEKTNWVMHQYHLGTEEDEKEGEYILSKVFYQQQQQVKLLERNEEDISESLHTMIAKVDPVTPKSATPEPRAARIFSDYESLQDPKFPAVEHHTDGIMEDFLGSPSNQSNDQDQNNVENINADQVNQSGDEAAADQMNQCGDEAAADQANQSGDEAGGDEASGYWWENESEYIVNSQQLVEGLSLCDDFLQSQSPNRDGNGDVQGQNRRSLLADYARLGPEDLKRDLEECQNLPRDPATEDLTVDLASEDLPPDDPAAIDVGTPPEFRLSQLEFESQDSYIAWGGSFQEGRVID